MKCPKDGAQMDHLSRHGVEIDHCPQCGGVWLDRGELDHLIEAVRPAVELANPDPAPRVSRGATSRKSPDQSKARKPQSRARDDRPGRSKRYYGRYSGRDRLRRIFEEIFDLDFD